VLSTRDKVLSTADKANISGGKVLSINEKTEANGGTLASDVYERLRQDILRGELPPGQKLRSEQLRDRYTVGNSPIREALNRLSSDGLVVREDQKGFHVAKVSRTELEELVRTRCWLEEIGLRQSMASHGTAKGTQWEEELVLAFHRLSRVPRSSNERTFSANPEWEVLHRAFHAALISACGSRWLEIFCTQLSDQADRYRQFAVTASYPKRNELDEHKGIFDAIIEGNPDEAVKRLHNHYQYTAKIIMNSDSEFLADDTLTSD
jgi:GntR family transcriptional regulator, carbon starvation induced regulator